MVIVWCAYVRNAAFSKIHLQGTLYGKTCRGKSISHSTVPSFPNTGIFPLKSLFDIGNHKTLLIQFKDEIQKYLT